MALLGQLTKQPDEKFSIEIDFSRRLASGESVDNIAVTARDLADDSDATSTIVASSSVSSPIATVNLKGGTDGKEYMLTVQATTDASPAAVHEADIKIIVEDT